MVRFFKLILATVLLSFFLSVIGAFMNYTPIFQREPNVYYASILESVLFSIVMITPVLLAVIILSFLIVKILSRFRNLSAFGRITIGFVLAIFMITVTIFMMKKANQTNDLYLIPQGYEGDVFVFYNVDGAPKLESENGYEVHVINEQGYFVTSEPDLDYGTVTDQYFYVDERGSRTPINDQCVKLFGTGEFSMEHGNQEIELKYTGFTLTKNQCGEEFINSEFNVDDSKEQFINDILKHYYKVDRSY